MDFVSRINDAACSQELIGPVLDALQPALLFVDKDGRIQAVNKSFGEFFGLDLEHLVGADVAKVGETWSRTFAEFMTYHETVAHPIEDHESDFLRDVEVIAPKHRFIEVASAPVRRNGAYAGRLWIMRDITHEREITELKIQYGGLRSADEIKSRFLTIASHQMRTPMNSVRWNLELLLAGDSGALPPESAEVLREAYKSVTNSISIVDDMLLAVDIEQRTLRLEKTAVDLADVLKKVIRDHARSAELKSITMALEQPPQRVPQLFIDAGKIETVFSRLVDNAVKYTPQGGTVTVSLRAEKDMIVVEVADSGIGIPEKEQVRLFERFYRSKKAIELNPNASGLGLYIAKFIVDAHDGRITYKSAEGKGTSFFVTLPRRSVN